MQPGAHWIIFESLDETSTAERRKLLSNVREAARQESAALLQQHSDPLRAGASHQLGYTAFEQAPKALNMKMVSCTLPAHVVASRMLKAGGLGSWGGRRDTNVQGRLLADWEQLHRLVEHTNAPKLKELSGARASLARVSVCGRVGFCICNKPDRKAFRRRLGGVTKLFFNKGTKTRTIHEQSRAVLRVHRPAGGRGVGYLFYVGFGNLSDIDFTVQPLCAASLVYITVEIDGAAILEHNGDPRDHDIVGATVDLKSEWQVGLLECNFENKVSLEDFRPMVFATPIEGLQSQALWPLPKPKAMSRRRAFSSLPASVASATATPQPLDEEEDEEEVAIEPLEDIPSNGDGSIRDDNFGDGWVLDKSSDDDVAAPTLAVRDPPRYIPRAPVLQALVAPLRLHLSPAGVRGRYEPKMFRSSTPTGQKSYLRLSLSLSLYHVGDGSQHAPCSLCSSRALQLDDLCTIGSPCGAPLGVAGPSIWLYNEGCAF